LKLEGVIFDVDGTLVDSNDAHAAAFVEAFAEFGFQVAFEDVRRLIGEGSDKLIAQLIGRYDEALAEWKRAIFMARYLPKVRAFPAVDTLLQKLTAMDFRLAVASSAARDELDALLEVARAKAYFAEVTDADEAERSGDTPYDAAAARRAGVPFLGVRCGGWAERDLQPAIGVYEDPADLFASLLKDPGCVLRTPS
jgi:phosphoglycolate phosphatase-like HAD superfamily hydrolase